MASKEAREEGHMSAAAMKKVDSCCGNVAGVQKRCTRPRVWSRWCKKHYLEEFGDPPSEVCAHGLDANHEPCDACFAPSPTKCIHGGKDSKACAWCIVARQSLEIIELKRQLGERDAPHPVCGCGDSNCNDCAGAPRP